MESHEDFAQMCYNLDPGVVALLEPVQEDATKNDIHTRIALIKLKQANIWGNSQYAAKVLEAAIEEGAKDKNAHTLLGQRLEELEHRASELRLHESVPEEAERNNAIQSDNTDHDSPQTESQGESTEGSDKQNAELKRIKEELSAHSEKIESLENKLEERLMEEIKAIKQEQDSIRDREVSLRNRTRSLQLSIKEMPLDRSKKLQEAMKESYDYSLTGKAECTVCHDRDAVRAVIPCGHLCLCDKCTDTLATKQQRCPLCRGNLLSTLKIFTAK